MSKIFFRVFRDDDFDRLGWAWQVANDKDFNDITWGGHTYDDDKESSIQFVRDLIASTI